MCSSFLNNKNAWFVLTDVNDGLKYLRRNPLETKVWTDEVTDNVMTTAKERYSAGVSDFRAIDGSAVRSQEHGTDALLPGRWIGARRSLGQ